MCILALTRVCATSLPISTKCIHQPEIYRITAPHNLLHFRANALNLKAGKRILQSNSVTKALSLKKSAMLIEEVTQTSTLQIPIKMCTSFYNFYHWGSQVCYMSR